MDLQKGMFYLAWQRWMLILYHVTDMDAHCLPRVNICKYLLYVDDISIASLSHIDMYRIYNL